MYLKCSSVTVLKLRRLYVAEQAVPCVPWL
jgi:hypothetical protein